jgi:hypothetical protein
MDFRLSEGQHDETLCAEIGAAAGQTDGGWSIEHGSDDETGEMVLTLPDGALTQQEVEAVVAAHDADAAPPRDRDEETLRVALHDPMVPEHEKAMMRRLGVR